MHCTSLILHDLLLNFVPSVLVMSQGGLACLMPLLTKVDELSKLLILQAIVQMCTYPLSHSIIMSDGSIIKYMATLCSKAADAQVT